MGTFSPPGALDRFANRRYGLRDDQVDAEPAEVGAGAPWVALDAARLAGCRRLARRRAHQTRLERERERGVGESGVLADLPGEGPGCSAARSEPGGRCAG